LVSAARLSRRHIFRIMTSVDLMSAATVCPFCKRISRTASAVMMEVIRCPPIESVTWAINPLVLISVTRPINWFRPLTRRKLLRRSLTSCPCEAR